jgi:hypothetical protein
MTLAVLGMLSRVFSDAPVGIFYTQKREDCSCICAQMSRDFFATASGVSYSRLGVGGHDCGCFPVYLTLPDSPRERSVLLHNEERGG